MKADHDPDDLLVLGRRGALSEADERRLRDVLDDSVEARWLHEAGLGFDAEAPLAAGDDVRIERIVRRVQTRASGSAKRRWFKIARAAAGGMLAAGVAVGAVQVSRTWIVPTRDDETHVEKPPAPLPKSTSHGSIRSEPENVRPEEVTAPAPAVEAPEVPVPDDRVAPSARRRESRDTPSGTSQRRVAGPAAAPAPTPQTDRPPSANFEAAQPLASQGPVAEQTAAGTFSAANRARMRGDATAAVALYERLQHEFPSSVEAKASNITLGLLYLQQGHATEALGAFQRSRASGTASAEALWGESQALAKLGRRADERAALEELLRRHPNSAYDKAARKRLAGLE